jgi:NifU-like protein involved in Fe-S cluster formation
MSASQVVRGYYERIVAADFPHAGEIEESEARIKAVRREGCHGHSQNLLFFAPTIRDGRLQDLKYECQYCEPTMYVAAELVSELIEGQPVARLGEIGDRELIEALGGQHQHVLRLARTALALLDEAID